MYSNKLAVAIKTDGKILREFGHQVILPFGSEYSIFLKNENHVRASVKIEIDGTDISDGVSLIIDPGERCEIERFIRNGNLHKGNKFKFIERTAGVESHRGVKVEDGLVKITFQFERVSRLSRRVFTKSMTTTSYDHDFLCSRGVSGSMEIGSCGITGDLLNFADSSPGITAPGSVSNQAFIEVEDFDLEPEKYTIILQLVGEVKGKPIGSYVSTRARTECPVCGHQSKSQAKFCSECGSSLQII